MNKNFITILCLLFFSCNNSESVSENDNSNIWDFGKGGYIDNTTGNIYYSNDQIREEKTKFGYKRFFPNGNLEEEYKTMYETRNGGYIEIMTTPHTVSKYYSNGNLKSVQNYRMYKQFPDLTWYRYYPDGSIKEKIDFSNFNRLMIQLVDGKDSINLMDEFGSENYYHTKTPNYSYSMYYPNGQVWIEGEFYFFKDSVYKDGEWKHFSDNGQLINSYSSDNKSSNKMESFHRGHGGLIEFLNFELSMEEDYTDIFYQQK